MIIKSATLTATAVKAIPVPPAAPLLDVRDLPGHPPGHGQIVFTGTDADDDMAGNARTNELHGGLGNDMFHFSPGGDSYFGDGGNDTVDYSSAPSAINVDLVRDQHGATGAGATGGAAGDTFDHVENIIGSDGWDTIRGGGQANVIVAGGGADYIEGRGGDDVIAGEAGADYILGGDGNDTIWAGHLYQTDNSNDTISGGNGDDRITGSHGNNFLTGDDGQDTIFGFDGNDNISGGNGDDVLYGDDSKAMSNAADGADIINGDAGNDTIFGGGGNDTLSGGTGNDRIDGGSGNDRIVGGQGADTLSGGLGTNTFAFTSANDGGDHIVDFQHSYIGYSSPWGSMTINTSDVIEINRAGFGLSDSFVFDSQTFQSGDHFVGKGTGPTFFYDTDDHTLTFDDNGVLPGGEHLLATFDNAAIIHVNDFLLV